MVSEESLEAGWLDLAPKESPITASPFRCDGMRKDKLNPRARLYNCPVFQTPNGDSGSIKKGAVMKSPIRYRVAVLALPMLALIATSGQVQAGPVPNDPVVLLLKGVYQPSVSAPNLGFSGVNLNDGTWLVTEIHGVTSIPGSTNQSRAVVGHFYYQTTSNLAAYDLPGGAILMGFTNETDFAQIPDGHGGTFQQSTFELTILDATGIYSPYKGGHNHMVDRIDILANGLFDESCFCIISEAGGSPLWWTSN